jgi:hypothetical protein
METRKRLVRARMRMAANLAHAPAVRRSLVASLGRVAVHSPDPVHAAAAAAALAHFRANGWDDASWDELGIVRRKRMRRLGGQP